MKNSLVTTLIGLSLMNGLIGSEKSPLIEFISGMRPLKTCGFLNNDAICLPEDDNTISVYSIKSGTLINTLAGHKSIVSSFDCRSDASCCATGGYDGKVFIRDATTGDIKYSLIEDSDVIQTVRFSADDTILITHSWDDIVTGWTFEEKPRKIVRKFYFSPAQKIIAVAPNHDGTILAVSCGNDDALAELWLMDDWGDHQKYISLVGQSGPAYALDWHPQQASLVTGSADGTLSIWDVETGTDLQRFDLYDGIINAVRFSHNGNYIAAGCAVDSRIALIDSRSNALIAELNAHRAGTDAVAWSPDDKLVSCSDREKKVKVWSVVP